MVSVSIEITHPDLLVGIVESHSVPSGPADAALASEIDAAVAKHSEPAAAGLVKSAIRDLLRAGGYKPAGRGKPASEYLAQAAARGEFPRISHVVDALNLVSLESGLPISLLDVERAMESTDALVIRYGSCGESYVFNSAGHEIDIEGLLSVARKRGPAIGNPVKDSMLAKTTSETTHTIAFIWASQRAIEWNALHRVCQRLGQLLRGTQTEITVIGSGARP